MRGSKVEVRPGVWRLRVVTGYAAATGHPRQASRTFTGSKKAADSALASFVTEVESGTAALDGAAALDAFLDRWLEHLGPHRSPTTIRGYREKLTRVRRDLGSVKVAKLTGQQLDRTYRRWLDEGTSPATVHGIHRVLSAALHQALRWGLVARAATELATPPSRGTAHPVALDPKVVVNLVEACKAIDPVLAAAVVVSATTGLRRGELCGLRWADVDLAGGTLWVRAALKYDAERKAVLGPTKTHQQRLLALDPGTVGVLAEHRRHVEACADAPGIDPPGEGCYVFTLDPSGSSPWLPDSYGHAFERITRTVGVKVRLQDLRHFAATQLIAAGIDVRTTAGRLGHADPSVTLKVYSSFVADRDRHAAAVLGELVHG